jgi:RNA polymerase sigma factor (TIGR02999 family)
MSTPSEEITLLLRRLPGEGKDAFDRLLPLVYAELRALAEGQLRRERNEHTLQPTALVHEAYLRLVGQGVGYDSKLQFLRVAAMTMRRILVDHARSLGRRKRRHGGERVELTASVAMAPELNVDLLELDDALTKLEARDPRKVRVVEMRYFGGMTIEETARVLDVSSATVHRDWEFARLWLLRELGPSPSESPDES